MNKKLLLTGTLLAALTLAGCGGKKDKETKPTGDQAKAEATGVEQVLTFDLGAEPKTLDPQLNSANTGGLVINNTFEGLVRLDDKGQPQPGVATSWEVSEDGKKYTFKLNPEAKWSDGKQITAGDFEYTFKRAVDPKTASEYAFLMFYIKGAQEFFEDKGTAEEVGVKAIDDTTLEVELNAPLPYFLKLLNFYTYAPTRKDVVEKNPEGWAKDPATAVSNGPFKLADYQIGDKIVLVKNPEYWDADNVKLEKINMTMIVDDATKLTAYQNGEVDFIDNVPSQEIQRLQMEDDTFYLEPQLGSYYYIFNVAKGPTTDVNVRKALTHAIDRKAITEEVTKGGQQPATGFVPSGLLDSTGAEFRKEAGDYGIGLEANVEQAKEYLAKAGYPNGKGFPKMTITYNTSEGHKAVAEAIQEMWKKNLGIDVTLQNQEWAVFQDTRRVGNFDVARGGWLGDYEDPMTFLDMWTSYSGNNDAQWSSKKGDFPANDKYTKLIEESKLISGVDRDKKLYETEKILMDEAIVMPIYYYTDAFMMKEKVKGWKRSTLGHWDLKNAYISK